MKTMIKLLTGVWLSFTFISSALASQLNPCYRILTYKHYLPSQHPIRYVGRLCATVLTPQEQAAVHEHMTAASIAAYRNASSTAPWPTRWTLSYVNLPEWGPDRFRHRTYPMMLGTWWNDDPLMLTTGQGYGFMNGGRRIWSAFNGENAGLYSAGGNCSIEAKAHLGRLSHFGNLQHLHFMYAADKDDARRRDQRIDATLEKALIWLAFTYQVATGKISPEQPLTKNMEDELSLPSIADNQCVKNAANVKVRTLFTPQGQLIEERNRRTPDVALGSMLHVLQDSFSPSHTCRVGRLVNGRQQALLVSVEDYTKQDKHEHAALDGYPQWLLGYLETGTHTYENDPIGVGAWLIAAVDHRLSWSEVEAYLRTTIFARVPSDDVGPHENCIGRQPVG